MLLTNVALLLGLWPIFEAAETSSACDKLLEATVVLRLEAPGDLTVGTLRAEKAAAGLRLMVSPDNLVRLEGLQRYACELNRNQGFGFTLRKHRITETMILRIIVTAISLNLTMLCAAESYGAYTATPHRMISPHVPLLLWQAYMLWPVFGAFASAPILATTRSIELHKFRSANGFVFGDDTREPWDDEEYRRYIHSKY